nr:MAG TPA: YopX protein [Caudoviricetes sp.]
MIPKFRVWLPDTTQMLRVKALVFEKDRTRCVCGYSFDFSLEDENATIMQSTGLKDKNGQEIFEGDVVDYKGRKAIIKWHGSYASFIYRFVDELKERGSEWYPLFIAYYHFEVIGNIYENKELLEVTE